MPDPSIITPKWLTEWMEIRKITVWGVGDLRGFSAPQDETGQRFPFALSWAIPMCPQIMASIQKGPNQAYADEYARFGPFRIATITWGFNGIAHDRAKGNPDPV